MVQRVKREHPEILAATLELRESFTKKTYDSAAATRAITRYCKIFKDFEEDIPVLMICCIERFEKGDLSDVELELSKRILKISIDKLVVPI